MKSHTQDDGADDDNDNGNKNNTSPPVREGRHNNLNNIQDRS